MWKALLGIQEQPQGAQLVAQEQQQFMCPRPAFEFLAKYFVHQETKEDDDFRETHCMSVLMSVSRHYREEGLYFLKYKCAPNVRYFILQLADRLIDLPRQIPLRHSPSELEGYLAFIANSTLASCFKNIETSTAGCFLLVQLYAQMRDRRTLTPSVALAHVADFEESFQDVMKAATDDKNHEVVTALVRVAGDRGENPLPLLVDYLQDTFSYRSYHPYVPPLQNPDMKTMANSILEYLAAQPNAECPKEICLVDMLCCGVSDEDQDLCRKIVMLTNNEYLPKNPGELTIHLLESGQSKAAGFIASRYCSQGLQTTLWRKVLESPNHEHLAQILWDEGVVWVETASNALNAMAKISSTHPTNASKFRRAMLTAKKVIGKDKCFKSLHPKRVSSFTPRVKMIIEECLRK